MYSAFQAAANTFADDVDQTSAGDKLKRRVTRACDQCRKSKSKCTSSSSNLKCSTCEAAGLDCSSSAPNFRRGPPKGYISAIERRLQQVEAILGVLINSQDPRAQGVISDLRQDETASAIIKRIAEGPFGPSRSLPSTGESVGGGRSSRTRRDKNQFTSRRSRELVTVAEDSLGSPSIEWQDILSELLEPESVQPSFRPADFSAPALPFRLGISIDEHEATSPTSIDPLVPINLYTFDTPRGEDRNASSQEIATEAGVGNLSVDENDQILYHDDTSGMPTLRQFSDRSDGRVEGGVWQLPMARTWPPPESEAASTVFDEHDNDEPVQMPPADHQNILLALYFTYVHPLLPVIHKPSFLSAYQQKNLNNQASSSAGSSSGKTPARVSNLLLLSMFAVASRYNDSDLRLREDGKIWDAGCDYSASARQILNAIFHESSITTCQSLILLAYREFGIGSLEQSWLYMGMAIRMAESLGLHRAADRWQRFGADVFSPEQKEERKQVWWSCVIVEQSVSCALGRPTAISERSYDTELPDVFSLKDSTQPLLEEVENWQPYEQAGQQGSYTPLRGLVFSYFRAAASLGAIVCSIIDKIYTAKASPWPKQKKRFYEATARLDQWRKDLPVQLHYDILNGRVVPLPHVLVLHIRYWSAVILLYRKFIPQTRTSGDSPPGSERRLIALQAFDNCLNAAYHVSTIASDFRGAYGLGSSPAFMPSHLFSAGIMFIAALSLSPGATHAAAGLQQILDCLKGMEVVWPNSARNWTLLNGAKVKFDERSLMRMWSQPSDRKRSADEAFTPVAGTSRIGTISTASEQPMLNLPGGDLETSLMAEMLGLDIPGTMRRGAEQSQETRAGSSLQGASNNRVATPKLTSPEESGSVTRLNEFSAAFSSFDLQSFTDNGDLYF